MDTGEPDRTETSSGFAGSPNRRPVASSRRARLPSTWARSRSEYLPSRRNALHSEHAIVKPAGTGTPRFVISARLAPFPPSTLFMSRVPSPAPLPKKKTDWVMPSAAAAESKLLGIGWRRSWIVARETGVTESIRAVRYGFQHSLEREVSERVHFEGPGYLIHLEIGGDELVAIGRVDAVIARPRDGWGADAHVHLARACCA